MDDKKFHSIINLINKAYPVDADSKGKDDERMSSIALQIKAYRGANGLTQQELAKRIGVPLLQISRWENRKNMPLAMALEKLKQHGVIKG